LLKIKIINLLQNFGLMVGCYFIFFIALSLLRTIFPGFDINQYQQSDINRLLEEDPLRLVILAVILAPVIEEGMFRTLIKPSPNEFIIFLCVWIFVLALVLVPEDAYWVIKYSFLLLFILVVYIFLREIIPLKWQLKTCYFLERNYILIWGLTSVVFGIVHIFNYVEGFELNFVLLLLIFPRIIAGYFFGKIKIENGGLGWPIMMHAMNNSVVFLILIPKHLFPG